MSTVISKINDEDNFGSNEPTKQYLFPDQSDFGSVAETAGRPYTEPFNQRDFGSVDEAADRPHTEALKMEYDWKRYSKQSQMVVLGVFILTIFVLLVADIVSRSLFPGEEISYLKDILTYTVPIFTFLLGMGTQPRDSAG